MEGSKEGKGGRARERRADAVQRCKCGGAACKSAKVGCKLGVGVGAGVGVGQSFQVSGLSRREPGSGVQVRVQVQDLNFTPYPHLYLITRT